MIINYEGKYKNIVKKCYINEGYTDFNDLIIIMDDDTILTDNYTNNTFIFENRIDKIVSVYLKIEYEKILKNRIYKINKILKKEL